jgi:hypothetical protein
MLGIDPDILVHRLGIDSKANAVKHKRRNFAPECNLANAKVEKLLQEGFGKERQYPKWLANVAMVKKANGKRMCVDFTDLNKACPKDSFPLPIIDMFVDSTTGHELLSFMDAFS